MSRPFSRSPQAGAYITAQPSQVTREQVAENRKACERYAEATRKAEVAAQSQSRKSQS
jgi:hypothetical protein